MSPRISVLMTAYNASSYIDEAITSICNQTFTDFEFLIVDDCSTDSTWEKIQRHVTTDSRIKAWRNDHNRGIASNRNVLVAQAQGEYVAWQDADDIALPSRLQVQYDFLSQHPDVGIVGGTLQFFDGAKTLSVRKYASDDKTLRGHIFRYSPVAQPAAMIRRSVMAGFSYEDKWSGTEDLAMSFLIGTKAHFANVSDILIKYRQQDQSITFRKLKRLERQTFAIRWHFAFGHGYHVTGIDCLYNFAQLLTLYAMPVRVRIWLFNKMRNSRYE